MMEDQPPQAACRSLVDKANALGGNDNITVIVARVDHLEKGAPSRRRAKDVDEAKTLEVRGRRGVRREVGGQRMVSRMALLPILLPLWMLKVAGRLFRVTLRFLWQ